MKALSVRQPWAWLLVHGHKDIENRTWQNGFRGQLLIHAGKAMTDTEYLDVLRFLASKERLRHLVDILPAPPDLERGGIVGRVDVVGCFADHASPWFMGPYGFLVRNQTTVSFRPYVGMLGLFEVPDAPDEPGEDVQPSLL